MKFNINDDVKVRLNPEGFRIHKEHWLPFTGKSGYTPPKVDAKGYSNFQLWDLMHVFGPRMLMGVQTPFETEILLEE